MPTKIIFKKMALEFPSGFKYQEVSETDFLADRKKPLQFMRINWFGGEDADMERLMVMAMHQQLQANSTRKTTNRISPYFPNTHVEESLYLGRPIDQSDEIGEPYNWMIYIKDWRGMELSIMCSGGNYNDDAPIWEGIIRSMRMAGDDDKQRSADATPKNVGIRLRHLNLWGRKSDTYEKKKTYDVEYAGDSPTSQEKVIINAILENEKEIAEKLADAIFRDCRKSFVDAVPEDEWEKLKPKNQTAQGWAMGRHLLNLFRSEPDEGMPKTVEDVVAHCVLDSFCFLAPSGDGKQRLVLQFFPDWDEEHALYVRFLDGQIEALGGAEVMEA